MRRLLFALAGAAAAASVVLMTGFAEIRVSAARGGAAVGLDNTVTTVVGPHLPVAYVVLLAVVGAAAVVALVVAVARLEPGAGVAFSLAFAAVALAAIIVSYTAWPILRLPDLDGDGPYGEGWIGWLEHGGRSSAVQVIAAVALVMPALGRLLRL